MFSLPLHARREELRRARAVSVPNVIRSLIVYGSRENFRIVSVGAVQRERRDDRVDAAAVGQARVDHRRRLVDAPADLRDDLVDDAHHVRVVDEADVGPLELAAALDVDPVGRVDHDLRDGVVAQQRLDRPVAEDVVGELADELAALLARERRAVERQLLGDRPVHLVAEILAVLLEELRAELGDARVVDPRLQVGVRIDAASRRSRGAVAAAVRRRERRVAPPSPCRERRSWRPMLSSSPGSGACAPLRRLASAPRAARPLRERDNRLREVGARLGEDRGLAAVDGERHGPVGRHLAATSTFSAPRPRACSARPSSSHG